VFSLVGFAVITASELEHELQDLIRLACRLMPPLNRRPHLFHESKSELIEAAQRLLNRVRGIKPRSANSFHAPNVDTGLTQVLSGNRAIPVQRR
jgi:hypothetical protein